jgi:hypothetical protein
MIKLMDYIEKLSRRESSGKFDNLDEQQKHLYRVLEHLSRDIPDKSFKKKEIEQQCRRDWPHFDLLSNKRSHLSDFCYNTVCVDDNENKFLLKTKRGEFRFVGFDWQSGCEVKIDWSPKGVKEPFTVGTYVDGEFRWRFENIIRYLTADE